jgi:hypothetical protein
MATVATPTTMGENPASLMSAVWTTPSHDTIVSSNLENWLVASVHDRGVLPYIFPSKLNTLSGGRGAFFNFTTGSISGT